MNIDRHNLAKRIGEAVAQIIEARAMGAEVLRDCVANIYLPDGEPIKARWEACQLIAAWIEDGFDMERRLDERRDLETVIEVEAQMAAWRKRIMSETGIHDHLVGGGGDD